MQVQPKLSDVIAPSVREPAQLDGLSVHNTERLRLLREVLGDQVLSGFLPGAVRAACDGAYWLSPEEAKDFDALACAPAKTSLPASRFGRGSVFAKGAPKLVWG